LNINAIAERFATLSLLILHGSRARGDAHAHSDWDFAYESTGELDELALRSELVDALGTDAVDLADLSRSGGLLRFRAASEGIAIFERTPGAFYDFAERAVFFWLDAGPVIEQAQREVLDRLG
jgi:predicted nucleotidyltransferase